jgi:hypothetical protein
MPADGRSDAARLGRMWIEDDGKFSAALEAALSSGGPDVIDQAENWIGETAGRDAASDFAASAADFASTMSRADGRTSVLFAIPVVLKDPSRAPAAAALVDALRPLCKGGDARFAAGLFTPRQFLDLDARGVRALLVRLVSGGESAPAAPARSPIMLLVGAVTADFERLGGGDGMSPVSRALGFRDGHDEAWAMSALRAADGAVATAATPVPYRHLADELLDLSKFVSNRKAQMLVLRAKFEDEVAAGGAVAVRAVETDPATTRVTVERDGRVVASWDAPEDLGSVGTTLMQVTDGLGLRLVLGLERGQHLN